jgi:hypothetical protein
MRTREQFIQEFRHEIEGWLLDAAMSGKHGAELSVWLRQMRQKIETKLGVMYDASQPQPANGKPAQPSQGARK